MTRFEIPHYCVPQRCGLCRFDIQGEDIVASEQPLLADSAAGCLTLSVTETGRVGLTYSARSFEEFEDRLFNLHCIAHCSIDVGYSLLLANRYAFEPPTSNDRRRGARLQRRRAAILSIALHCLTPELCLEIAGYIICEDATEQFETLCFSRRSSDCSISFEKDIWAYEIALEGISYVATLSNTFLDGGRKVLDYGQSPNLTEAYIIRDHFGIRDLVFAGSNSLDRKPDQNAVWWHTIPISSVTTVQGKSDGIKLRSLSRGRPHSGSEGPLAIMDIAWPTPFEGTQIRSLRFGNLAPTLADPLIPWTCRMLPFLCFNPGIRGFSIAWSGRLVYLHAHVENETMSHYDFVQATYKNVVWVYFPMDWNEVLTHIWTRSGRFYRNTGLMFQTNAGRVVMAGPVLPPRVSQSSWKHLCAAGDPSACLYFEYSKRGIHRLALLGSSGAFQHIPRLETSTPCPGRNSMGEYFYSAASLQNVHEIKLCRKTHLSHAPITGMLLRYSDGHQACVGECGVQTFGETIDVSSSTKLFLGFMRTERKNPYLSKVELIQSNDEVSLHWLDLSWEGTLEWWFSYKDCKVHYGCQSSPDPI
ncbi:hypothetical protein JX265_013698 [Neoarthrinium moseri]|uniref:Uncharacterized protein n=1 Tax=Neoarthrinium moseri TaxID=1658444 RepID=A0A9P9W811_9PEZI|nr:hypothetical protein JX266_012084 [Neoarthrinium moseri]KAI1849001.1 hypothetical protein JX265_013698 [Neoarthrinium moseri]